MSYDERDGRDLDQTEQDELVAVEQFEGEAN